MEEVRAITGAEAGLPGEAQIRIALRAMSANGGIAQTSELYRAIEQHMKGAKLSEQGKASLRSYINRTAVQAGYVYPLDPSNAGWRITPEGTEFLEEETVPEEVTNVDTKLSQTLPSNSVRGAAFEKYILRVLKNIYPNYAWYPQGVHKHNERGVDFIGSQIGRVPDTPRCIGAQVKFHNENTAPAQLEWLKFLAGCFSRHVDHAIFITTGRLTSEQRREAHEAHVLVIEGRAEVSRVAKNYQIEEFELFDQP